MAFKTSNIESGIGIRLTDSTNGQNLGRTLSSLGDINGDGTDDFVIGAPNANLSFQVGYYTYYANGAAYVVFGTDQGFPDDIDLSRLDGSDGFVISEFQDYNGDNQDFTVSSAGDFNNDGINDVLVGVRSRGEGFNNGGYYGNEGAAYVIFGSDSAFQASIKVSDLAPGEGVEIIGPNLRSDFGYAVAGGGDIDGDGIDDLLIGGPRGGLQPTDGYNYYTGGVSLISGSGGVGDIDLADTPPTFVGDENGDEAARTITVIGDFNGDGIDDFAIGAPGTYYAGGSVFVVFGDGSGLPGSPGALNGYNGFVISADYVDGFSRLGQSVAAAGDVNGDGLDDLIVGAPRFDYYDYNTYEGTYGGGAFVIFGSTSPFPQDLDVSQLDGSDGFKIIHNNGNDIGFAVAGAGDLNGDGYDDVVVTGRDYDVYNTSAFVVFGGQGTATVELSELSREQGLVIEASGQGYSEGVTVAGLGDVNGDGVDDLGLGSRGYNSQVGVNVIFGSTAFGGVNDAPTAADTTVEIGGGTVIDFAEFGFDLDFDSLSLSSLNGEPVGIGERIILPSGVALLYEGGSRVRVDPSDLALGDTASDQLTFSLSDGDLNSAAATLTLNLSFNTRPAPAGQDGFTVYSAEDGISLGDAVSVIGDVNGDGIDDIIIGAPDRSTYDYDSGTDVFGHGGAFSVFGTDQGFPAALNTLNLDGSNGFTLTANEQDLRLGASVAGVGDVNGDGIDDFIVAAGFNGYVYGRTDNRSAFVVFGNDTGLPAQLDISELDGTNGFEVIGPQLDNVYNGGLQVAAAGDVNGDGFDDFLIGETAALASYQYFNFYTGSYESRDGQAGRAFVVFGSDTFSGATLDIDTAAPGQVLDLTPASAPYSDFGRAVSAIGDINGDGVDDFAVGGDVGFDYNYTFYGSSAFIVFGNAEIDGGLPDLIDPTTLDGTNGFIFTGQEYSIGQSISGIGDFNGDNIDDILVGAPFGAADDVGGGFVLFGSAGGFNAIVKTGDLNGANGFKIAGATPGSSLGTAASAAGDLNGDGYDDLAIVAFGYGLPDGDNAGAAYVLYGTDANLGAEFSIGDIDGTNGFRLVGPTPYSHLGGSFGSIDGAISRSGDINGDGRDDLLVGVNGGTYNGYYSGVAYVLFGGGVAPGLDAVFGVGNYGFNEEEIFSGDFSGGQSGLTADGDIAKVTQTTKNIDVGRGYGTYGRLTLNGGTYGVDVTVTDDPLEVARAYASVNVGTSGGDGILTIENGATVVSNNFGYYSPGDGFFRGGYSNFNIGRGGGYGKLIVTGAGSLAAADGEGARITVGRDYGSKGYLEIKDGGKVGTLAFNVGRTDGSYGSVSVEGAGSMLEISSAYGQYNSFEGEDFSGDAPGAQIGRNGGSGRLEVVNGGSVRITNVDELTDNPFFSLGRDYNSYGYTLLSGTGSTLTVEQIGPYGDDDNGGAFVGIGRSGQGKMVVTQNAVFDVLGSGATIDLGSNFLSENPNSYANELIISAGGVVNVDSGQGRNGGVRIARSEYTNGKVVVDGVGSQLNVSTEEEGDGNLYGYDGAFIQVGRYGNGYMEVLNGGVVTIDGGGEKFPLLHVGAGGNNSSGNAYGYLRVDGAGSKITLTGSNADPDLASTGFLSVGRANGAQGRLVISNGGVVELDGATSSGEIAGNAGTTGDVLVTGSGSVLDTGKGLAIGADFVSEDESGIQFDYSNGGYGVLYVEDQGVVIADHIVIGDSGSLYLSSEVQGAVRSTGLIEIGGDALTGVGVIVGDLNVIGGSIQFDLVRPSDTPGVADTLDQLFVNGDVTIEESAFQFSDGIGALADGDVFDLLFYTGALIDFDPTAVDLSVLEADLGADLELMVDQDAPGTQIGDAKSISLRVVDAVDNTVGVAGFIQRIDEGNDSDNVVFTFTIDRAGDLDSTLTVDFAVAGSGDNPADASDFESGLPSGSVTFDPQVDRVTVDIAIAEDDIAEADEGFTFTISNPSSDAATEFTVLNPAREAEIINDDAVGSIFFADFPFYLETTEGDPGDDQSLGFTIGRDGSTSTELTVEYEILVGFGVHTAEADDIDGALTGAVTFGVGEDTAVITVDIAEDLTPEGDEDFQIVLTGFTGAPETAFGFGQDFATGRILNDDGDVSPGYLGTGVYEFSSNQISAGHFRQGFNYDYNTYSYEYYSDAGTLTVTGSDTPTFFMTERISAGTAYPDGGNGVITIEGGTALTEIVISDVDDPQNKFVGIDLGVAYGGEGQLNIVDGARVIINEDAIFDDGFSYGFSSVNVGRNGGTGTLTISGEGSTLFDDGFAGRLTVGRRDGGDGTVRVEDGGYLHTNVINIGRQDGTGRFYLDDADVVVEGFYPGSATGLQMGRDNGDGKLFISNGGAFTIRNIDGEFDGAYATLGRGGGYALIEVDGAGSSFSLQQIGDVDYGYGTPNLALGRDYGQAIIRVTNGGEVNLTGDQLRVDIGKEVANEGNESRLEISGGSTVTHETPRGGTFDIGEQYGARGVVTVSGAGSQLIARSDDPEGNSGYAGYGMSFNVGNDGRGRLEVTDGGSVLIDGGYGRFPTFIVGQDDYGYALVDGAGSTVELTGLNTYSGATTGFSSIGQRDGADGTLVISNGGAVRLTGENASQEIAGNAGTTGRVTVTGAGSELDSGVFLRIGADSVSGDVAFDIGGDALLEILNGGRVIADSAAMGDSGVLSIDGGVFQTDLEATGSFLVGGTDNIGDATIEGALMQTGGRVEIEIAAFDAAQADFLTITGDAAFEAGSIELDLTSLSVFSIGDEIAFLSAGGALTVDETQITIIGAPEGGIFSVERQAGEGGATELVLTARDAIPNTVGLVGLNQSRPEGDPDEDPVFTFTVQRAGEDLSQTLDVDFVIDATPEDFVTTVFSGTFSFAADQTEATVSVTVDSDLVVEEDETLTITISNPVTTDPLGYTITSASLTGTIENDDDPDVLRIEAVNADVVEGDPGDATEATFNIIREGSLLEDVEVFYVVQGGTADSDDFTNGAPQSGSVTILAGETTASLSIGIEGDFFVEENEDFTVALTGFGGDQLAHVIGVDDTADGSIENDDEPDVISIVRTASAEEGDSGAGGTVNFTVTRTGNLVEATNVSFIINNFGGGGANDTIADDDDIVGGGLQTGSVFFDVGQSTAIISVDIVGDETSEAGEEFGVSLVSFDGNPLGHTFGIQNAVGTIINDDAQTPILPGGNVADMFGDPHIVTLDGLGYDFQAVGEFTLVQSTDSNLPLDVQVRTAPAPGSDLVSVITAMATDMGAATEGGDPVSLMLDVFGDPALLIDGVATTIDPAAGQPVDAGAGQVFFDGSTYTIVYGTGEALQVDLFDGFLNVSVFLYGDEGETTRTPGTIAGIMGNADGDISNEFFLRNGDPIPEESITFVNDVPALDFDFLYGTYADSWRITDETSFFTYENGQGTADFTDTNFPAGVLSVDALPEELLEAAEAAIDALGIEDPALREAALLDFALTGDEQFAAGASAVDTAVEAETTPEDAPLLPDTIGVIAGATEVLEGDEGVTDVTFTFYRIGDAVGALDIDFSVGGDVDADDFLFPAPGGDSSIAEGLSGVVSFGDGEMEASLTFQLVGDSAPELNERLRVDISAPDGVLVGAASAITLVITDDFIPIAFADEGDGLTTNEDTPLDIDEEVLLANDIDQDGDDLTVISVDAQSANSGTVMLVDGVITYDPTGLFGDLAEGAVVTDTFSYTISDGDDESTATATATIEIVGVNDGPIITPPPASNVGEADALIEIDLDTLVNDAEDDDIAFSLVELSFAGDGGSPRPASELVDAGAVSLDDDTNVLTIDPNALADAFELGAGEILDSALRVQAVDAAATGERGDQTFSVGVFLTGVNDAPTSAGQAVSTNEDTPLNGQLPGEDLDGDDLTFALADGGATTNGSLTLNADGSFTYTPDANFNGGDSFTYTVSDGVADPVTATATITVDAVNDAPVAQTATITATEDNAGEVQLAATDIDSASLTFSLASGGAPRNGSVTISATGRAVYTPNANFNGADSFVYLVSDGALTDTATVTVGVTAVNDAPVAGDDAFSVDETGTVSGSLLANDSDIEGPVTVSAVNGGAVGASTLGSGALLTVGADGAFTYDPNGAFEALAAGATDTDSFTYTIRDANGAEATATVTLTIQGETNDTGSGGPDVFEGSGGNDVFNGGGGSDTISGGGGSDELSGGGGKDLLQGGGGKDFLSGGGGKDTLEGGGGRDLLQGGGGKDLLDGQGGKDTMEGGGGKDEILGGRGSDILTGGGGRDTFVFGRGDGKDTITDFRQRQDKIEIEDGAESFDDLTITQVGDDVQIRFSNVRITVEDDEVGNFTASDFIF